MGFGGVSGWQLLVVLTLYPLAIWGLWFIIKRAVLSALRHWDRERGADSQGG